MSLLWVALGVVLVACATLALFLGGYMVSGEAHQNLHEGLPGVALGIALAVAGVAAIVRGARGRARRLSSR